MHYKHKKVELDTGIKCKIRENRVLILDMEGLNFFATNFLKPVQKYGGPFALSIEKV